MKIKVDVNTSENQEVDEQERLEQQSVLTVVRSDLRLDVNK